MYLSGYNGEATALVSGEVVRVDPGVAQTVVRAQSPGQVQGLLGVVNSGVVGPGGTVNAVYCGITPVRLDVGLTPQAGNALYVSAVTAGRASTVVAASGSIGTVLDTAGYATTDLVLALFLAAGGAAGAQGATGATGVQGATGVTGATGAGASVSVVNLAALSALSTAGLVQGTHAFVQTKRVPYVLDKTGTGTPTGNFSVAAAGGGVWNRVLMPVQDWYDLAVSTGFFVNRLTGNDEAAGTSGAPIQSINEMCARLYGQEFVAAGGTANLVADSTNTADGILWGFTGLFFMKGVETTIHAGITLNGAGDLVANSAMGFVQDLTASFDFESITPSDSSRCVFVRRPDTLNGKITYAATMRHQTSGANSQAKISPQFSYDPAVGVSAAVVQPFATNDVVSLVRFTAWPAITACAGIRCFTPLLDFSAGRFRGAVIPGACGFKGRATFGSDCAFGATAGGLTTIHGLMFPNGYNTLDTAGWSMEDVGIGSAVLAHQESVVYGSPILLLRFAVDNATLDFQGCKAVIDNGWFQNTGSCFVAQGAGEILIGFPPATNDGAIGIGIGDGVPLIGGVFRGSKIYGAQFAYPLGSGIAASPWQITGVLYPTSALSVEDGNGSAVYL